MTRTYSRNEATYDRKLIDMMVEAGMAKSFPNGIFVVKTDDRSFAVRPHQIYEIAAEAMPVIVIEDDNAAEADLADQDAAMDELAVYEAKAAALGISVEEYTDGEYTSRVCAHDRSAEDALFAKFGV